MCEVLSVVSIQILVLKMRILLLRKTCRKRFLSIAFQVRDVMLGGGISYLIIAKIDAKQRVCILDFA
jgi:hypothetical protein